MYCMATPTVVGAKEMLTYLGAGPEPPSEGNGPQKVILTDLREEAVVYINGTPFVLRELNKPVETLKHVGITGSVVRLFSYTNLDTEKVQVSIWAGWIDWVTGQMGSGRLGYTSNGLGRLGYRSNGLGRLGYRSNGVG